MSAWTSPGGTERLAPSRATVGPKRFAMPVRKRAGTSVISGLQVPLEGRANQVLRSRIVHVLRSDEKDARVHQLLDRLAQEVAHHGLDSQLSHVHRVLEDDAVELAGFHGVEERLAGIEAEELHLARFRDVLEGEQHSRG